MKGRLISSGNEDTYIEPINFQNPIEIRIPEYKGKVNITIQIKGQGELRFGYRRLNRDHDDRVDWVQTLCISQEKMALVGT